MDDKDVARDVARGVAREKTRESLAVFMAIGAALLAWVLGAATEPWIGVAAMLGLFWLIWRFYRRR